MTTESVEIGTRQRTRSNRAPKIFTSSTIRTYYGTSTTTNGILSVQVGDVMSDTVTPDFAQRRSRGEIILNPMSKSSIEFDASGGSWKMQSSNGYEKYDFTSNCITTVHGLPQMLACTLPIEAMITYAQTKALGSVRSSDFMGLVAAAEFKKTIRMLANPLGTLTSLVNHVYLARKANKNLHIDIVNGDYRRVNGRMFKVRTTKYKGPGHRITAPRDSIVVPAGDAISGSVLAYNLGLQPLLSDIESIFKGIPQAHQLERQSFRASSSETQVLTNSGSLGESVFRHWYTGTTTHKVKVRAVAIGADTFNILQDFGMSIYDVPEALWEVIPYSFVVDYVVNVGDVLAAMRAQSTQKILGTCTTVTIESETERLFSGTTSTSTGWVVTQGASCTQRYKVTAKNRSIGFDRIGLTFKPVSKIVTPSHIQNVLSLTVQQLIGLNSKRPKTYY